MAMNPNPTNTNHLEENLKGVSKQEDLVQFIKGPKTTERAARISMDKRVNLLNSKEVKMSKPKTIEEALIVLVERYFPRGKTLSLEPVDEALATIEALLLERIEDDPITADMKVNTPWLALENRHRNELRAEQRNFVPKLLRGDE